MIVLYFEKSTCYHDNIYIALPTASVVRKNIIEISVDL